LNVSIQSQVFPVLRIVCFLGDLRYLR